jgi:hypothetical protein
LALAGRRRSRRLGTEVGLVASFHRRLKRRGRAHRDTEGPDEGFALLDILAGVTLLGVSMVGIGSVIGTQLLNISSTTSQNTGAALLNQAMEEVRAIPYQLVANGLSTSDSTIATDPDISINGISPNQTYTFVPTGELIPHASLSYTQAPFVPHITTKTIDSTTFTIAAYPTIDASASGVYRVTVIVTWKGNQLGGVSHISAETLVYSESSGCLTDTNHPFAAPCQPFLYAQSSAGSGASLSVSGGMAGVSYDDAGLDMPNSASSMQIEQTSSTRGSAETSGAEIDTPLGTQEVGSGEATSGADNDPGSPTGLSQSNSTTQSGLSLSVSGSGSDANSIDVSSDWSETATSTSTASASTTPTCADLGGTTQTTGLPCTSVSESESGTVAALQMGLYAGAVSLLSAPLISVSTSPSKTGSFVARYTSPSGTYCPSTSGDGCVHAGAQRSIGTVELAGLPGLLEAVAPSGWGNSSSQNPKCPSGNYMVALANYSDTAAAESGENANTATNAIPNGSSQPYLCYWNGSGYTSLAVSLGSTPQTLSIPTLSLTDSAISGTVEVTVSPSLTIGSVTSSTTTPSGCTTPCQSSVTISSPISGSIAYDVTLAGDSLASLTINVNLGDLTVRTSYQAAP